MNRWSLTEEVLRLENQIARLESDKAQLVDRNLIAVHAEVALRDQRIAELTEELRLAQVSLMGYRDHFANALSKAGPKAWN